MSLSHLAVNRPVTTLMAAIICALLGIVSLSELAVDLMPDLEYPTVTVTTQYPGAGPEEVETLITRPLEQVLSSVTGFERLSSRSLEGSSSVRVQFRWGAELDAAVEEMRQAIDKIRSQLPDDIDPPYLRRYDANDSPIIYLGLNSDLAPVDLTRLSERAVVPRLERLEGVARVGMRGEVRREIQLDLDRAKLEALGIGVNQVVAAVERGNVSQPAGDIEEGHLYRLIRSRSEFTSLEEIRDLVVYRSGDAVVRVRDVATVIDGHRRITQRTRTNGDPGIMVYVFKQAGANTIEVSDAVHAEVADLNRELRNAQLTIRLDKSTFIRNAISNIQVAATLGMGLAMVILLLFLRSFSSMGIIAISMPLSVLATFLLIHFRGYTLNMVSFGGLALGIGMLVDNSIVVLESIYRKREEGMKPRDAAVAGTREVSGAITASTLTTLIVFLPLGFVSGVTGVLLHQLAFVVCCSMICSLAVSLTLTPTLAAIFVRRRMPARSAGPALPSGSEEPGKNGPAPRRFGHRFRKALRWFEDLYDNVLEIVLRHPGKVTLAMLFVAALCLGLLPRIGTEFLPATDDGRIGITGVMSPGIRIDALDRQSKVLEQHIMNQVPEADTFSAFIGDDAEDGDDWNECRIIVQLVPRSQRTASVEDVRERIDSTLPPLAGMRVRSRVYSGLPLFRMFSSNGGDNIAVLIRGYDRETAAQLSELVTDTMKSIPGLINVEVQQDDQRPELITQIDRPKASRLGVTVSDITQAIETTFRGTQATVFRQDGDEFDVIVRLRPEDRALKSDLGRVSVASEEGVLVPLANLVNYRTGTAPVAIDRLDRQRVTIITAGSEGRDLGSVVGDLQAELSAIPVPEGFQIEVAGDWEEQQESFSLLARGFLLAILLMYMVMAAQFESIRDPLLILVTLPLAGVGVLLVLTFWDTTLNVQSFIGLIVLAGVVVNNAIVLVDYFNQLRSRTPTAPTEQLVRQAAVRRFRPIVMTTLTTILGMMPVALGWGDGSELQSPMARVVIGGLLSGTVMTLVAIPIVLQYFVGSSQPSTETSIPDTDAPSSADKPVLVGAE